MMLVTQPQLLSSLADLSVTAPQTGNAEHKAQGVCRPRGSRPVDYVSELFQQSVTRADDRQVDSVLHDDRLDILRPKSLSGFALTCNEIRKPCLPQCLRVHCHILWSVALSRCGYGPRRSPPGNGVRPLAGQCRRRCRRSAH